MQKFYFMFDFFFYSFFRGGKKKHQKKGLGVKGRIFYYSISGGYAVPRLYPHPDPFFSQAAQSYFFFPPKKMHRALYETL